MKVAKGGLTLELVFALFYNLDVVSEEESGGRKLWQFVSLFLFFLQLKRRVSQSVEKLPVCGIFATEKSDMLSPKRRSGSESPQSTSGHISAQTFDLQ